jgi:hypothetical protein
MTSMPNSGQGGLQLKVKSGDFEYGLYAAQFHDKMPQFYPHPDTGVYEQVYGEDIRTVGFSVSTLVGETNVAAEMSFRDNMPLVASGNTVIVPESAGLMATGTPRLRAAPCTSTSRPFRVECEPCGTPPPFSARSPSTAASASRTTDQLDPLATRDATALHSSFRRSTSRSSRASMCNSLLA